MPSAHHLVGDFDVELTGDADCCRRLADFLPVSPNGASAGQLRRSVRVRVTAGQPEPAGGRGEVMRHHLVSITRDFSGEFVMIAPGVSARLLNDEAVDFRCVADASAQALQATFEIVWPMLLPRHGLMHLHAGAVRDPRGLGWILTGDANTGKSTSTLALATSGWSFAADDAVYLERQVSEPTQPPGPVSSFLVPRSGFFAHGWSEPVRLTRRSAESLAVGRVTPAAPAKAPAVLDDDRARRRVEGFPIHRVVFTEFGPRSALRRLSASESLVRLLRSSGWIVAQPIPAAEYLQFLAEVATVPAVVLESGPELLEQPARLAALLDTFDFEET